MTEPFSWAETAAGRLARAGDWPGDDREQRAAERAAEWRQARMAFDAAVAADPAWQAVRAQQQDLAAAGWTGQVIEIDTRPPPELAPLYAAREAASARTGTWGPGSNGAMVPTNDVAEQIEQHSRDVYEKARLRQQAANLHLPPGVEAL
jgi:hypothetical protein